MFATKTPDPRALVLFEEFEVYFCFSGILIYQSLQPTSLLLTAYDKGDFEDDHDGEDEGDGDEFLETV